MFIVQIHKGVIQKNKRLFLLEEGIHQCQPHTKQNAVNGARTEIVDFPRFTLFIYMDRQIMIDQRTAEVTSKQLLHISSKIPLHSANILIGKVVFGCFHQFQSLVQNSTA